MKILQCMEKDNKQDHFCYIDDLVSGILKMMKKEEFSGPINLGNPSEISILDLANEIIDLTGSKSKIIIMIYQLTILK